MRRLLKSATTTFLAFVLAFGFSILTAHAQKQPTHSGHTRTTASQNEEFSKLPKPGAKVTLDAEHYFVYGFDKRPKIGSATMKVEIFRRDGKPDTSFVVKGDVDMPSMRGAHSAGEKEFTLSKKGAYLFPASIVMPGDWEFRFTFEKDGKVVFRGAHEFEV